MSTVTADGNNHISGLAYDPSGNTLGDGLFSYHWNAESQMTSGAGVAYLCDGDGQRVEKVADLLLESSQVLIYFKTWNIWPSAENFDLFDGYRRSLGEHRPLSESQVHLFVPGDQATFTSILSMGLYFVWDVDVFDTSGEILVTFSHDEWMEFRAHEAARTKQIEQGLAGFELKHLTR